MFARFYSEFFEISRIFIAKFILNIRFTICLYCRCFLKKRHTAAIIIPALNKIVPADIADIQDSLFLSETPSSAEERDPPSSLSSDEIDSSLSLFPEDVDSVVSSLSEVVESDSLPDEAEDPVSVSVSVSLSVTDSDSVCE